MVYVFDTNSLCVLGNYYPARFPSFWERFDAAATSGLVVSVREVYNELQGLTDKPWLLEWARANRGIFQMPSEEETGFVGEIFGVPHFRMLVGNRQRLGGRPVADPFVIACAKVREGCVVTEEVLKENAAKIPNVCQHFGVMWTDVEGFLDRNGWVF